MNSTSDSKPNIPQNTVTSNKRFYSRDPKILERPQAIYMLQLMTAHDVLRSGLRWIENTKVQESPAQRTEHLVAVLTVCSWTHETILLIRKGRDRKNPPIYRSMVENQESLCRLWDEIKKQRSSRLRSIKRIRNQHLFHFFDQVGPERIRDLVRATGSDQIPMVESDGPRTYLETSYPPAYVCLGSALIAAEIDLDHRAQIKQEIHENLSIIKDFMSLLQALLAGIGNDIGLELVRLNDKQEIQ